MSIITAERAAEARARIEKSITRSRRDAASARVLADLLGGRYITKKLEPEITAAIPGCRVAVRSSGGYNPAVTVSINYAPGTIYDEANFFEIAVADVKTRRCDADKLRAEAARMEETADERAARLARMDTAVALYNDLARQYAAIWGDLHYIINDLPWADYSVEDAIKRAKTPEEFAAALAD